MFKSLSQFVNSNNTKWVFVAIVVAIVFYSMFSYSSTKGYVMDTMTGGAVKPSSESTLSGNGSHPAEFASTTSVSSGDDNYKVASVATPADLLPTDSNSSFASLNPVGNNAMPDMLQSGSLIGVDTIGQTLKNANLQLRSDPVITKTSVGPWNNSTYEPDTSRVPLELGCSSA